MKAIKILIVSILFWSITAQSFFWTQKVSAQASCDACQNTPKFFDSYIKVMQKNITKILYVPKEATTENSLANSAKAIRNALNQAQVTLLLAEILFAAPGDIWSDLKNMAKSVPQKRDRDALLALDKKISDGTLALIQQSDYNKVVSQESADLLDKSLKDMGGWISLKKDKDGNYRMIQQKISYRELAKFLWGLNMWVKHFHARSWYTELLGEVGQNANITLHGPNDAMTEQQKQDAEGLTKTRKKIDARRDFLVKTSVTQNKQRSPAQEWVMMDPEKTVFRVRTIEQDYQCAQGLKNECNSLQRIRKENRKLTKDMLVKNTKSAITTIVDATQRLGALLGIGSPGQIEAVNQRKRALLHSQRGSETDKRLETGYVNKAGKKVASLRKSIFKSEQKSQDLTNSSASQEKFGAKTSVGSKDVRGHPNPLSYDQPEEMLDLIKTIGERLAKEPKIIDGSNASNIKALQNNQNIALRKDLISKSVGGVLSLQDTMKNRTIFKDPRRVTQQFPELSRLVYETVNIIGRKNQEKSLIWNMGKVCELQCTNLQGRCWWMED